MHLFMNWFKESDPKETKLISDLKAFIADFEARAEKRSMGHERDVHIATGYDIVISELRDLLQTHVGERDG